MKKRFLFFLLIACTFQLTTAQTMEELITQKAEKEANLKEAQGKADAVKKEVDALSAQIDGMIPWKFGAFGTLGFNFSDYNNWYSRGQANTQAVTIGITANAFANLKRKKYFWRNAGQLNLGWLKFDDKDIEDEDDGFRESVDAINFSSLFGYNISSKFAISTLAGYRSTILSNFNDPGFLDIGVGGTWTPIADLVVVIHPLNYNFVFSKSGSEYTSSLGAKIVADYTRQLPKGISWKSNFAVFMSYEDASNLSSWTWVNGLSFKIWKGIGVGLDFGLRGNKQEAYNSFLTRTMQTSDDVKIGDISDDENELQTYWLIGFSYGF